MQRGTPSVTDLPRLVSDYTRESAAYLSAKYNELQARQELIDPLFEFLGWDVTNKQKLSQSYKDVLLGKNIKLEGENKAPDYAFRIGGTTVFFVEAKKPKVDIETDPEPAYQLRRYAWSAKLPISILTNFRQFAIYDTSIRPRAADKASTARIIWLQCTEYQADWKKLEDLVSKTAVLRGSLESFQSKTLGQKGTTTVDSEFLRDMEKWRTDLAKAIATRNTQLDAAGLNFVVQQTIDRIVFLRICEDRGIEPQGLLRTGLRPGRVYKSLFEIFEAADQKYNSGLFHFNEHEKRSEPSDLLSPRIKVDDESLEWIIKNLYYPNSPYQFSVIPAAILGQVYEQFLGRVIRLTPTHRAVVEEKPEVRKAGGVFYTPAYVVNFLIRQTIESALQGKTPEQLKSFRIVDPACGSGSFLIAAYDALLRWHLDWYLSHPGKEASSALYEDESGKQLTIAERKRILQSSIFGVDLDTQAVEVTKLSLHLKVLEGETDQTLGPQLRLYHDRALPDLGANIKQGNALVDPDILGLTEFDIGEVASQCYPFDWQTQFPFLRQSGGFDIVIGNPPWGADVPEAERIYLRNKYGRIVKRIPDSYLFFIDKFLGLAKSPGGMVGIVLPSTVLNQDEAILARDMLCDKGLEHVVNLGAGVFGKKVLNTTTVVTCQLGTRIDSIRTADLSRLPDDEKPRGLNNLLVVPRGEWLQAVRADKAHTLFVGDFRAAKLLTEARQRNPPLSQVLDGDIQRGVSPDFALAHVLSKEELSIGKPERACIRPSISGEQIKPYQDWKIDQYIIYVGKADDISDYPNAQRHIERYRDKITCPEVRERKHPWWALHRKRDSEIFDSPKFIGLTTSKTVNLIYDEKDSLVVTDSMFVFRTRKGFNPGTVLAIMQSRPFLFLYRVANQGESRVIPQLKAAKLEPLPFPNIQPGGRLDESLSALANRAHEIKQATKASQSVREKESLDLGYQSVLQEIDLRVCEAYGFKGDDATYINDWLQS